MGCDIHPVVQWLEYPAKNDRPDWWSELAGEWKWGRSYTFFARLAGVRCGECEYGKCTHAIVPPRGWPDGKVLQSLADWGGDLHTPTWFTLAEFKEAAKDCLWPEVVAAIAAMEAAGHKTRIVIAFDN